MPGNKKPRKPKKLRTKQKPAETTDDDSNIKNTGPDVKSFGTPKGSQSINSPAMTRGSARSR